MQTGVVSPQSPGKQRRVTRERFFKAADEASAAAGKRPTWRAIRKILGSGSYSTFKRFYSEWEEARQRPLDPPSELAVAAEELTTRLWQDALKTERPRPKPNLAATVTIVLPSSRHGLSGPTKLTLVAERIRERGRSKADIVVAPIEQILETHGAPLFAAEIHGELPEHIKRLYPHKAKLARILQSAVNKGRLVQLPKKAWWLSDRPYDESRYGPGLRKKTYTRTSTKRALRNQAIKVHISNSVATLRSAKKPMHADELYDRLREGDGKIWLRYPSHAPEEFVRGEFDRCLYMRTRAKYPAIIRVDATRPIYRASKGADRFHVKKRRR